MRKVNCSFKTKSPSHGSQSVGTVYSVGARQAQGKRESVREGTCRVVDASGIGILFPLNYSLRGHTFVLA